MSAATATRIEQALSRQLEMGRSASVFPGASASVAIWEGGGWRYVDQTVGERAPGADAVTPNTIYDLASLTKPWVATAALRLHHRGVFALDAPIDELIPEARERPLGARTWEMALSHRAGLRAWVPFYETLPGEPGSVAAEAWILKRLVDHGDANQEGVAVYSDLGYILAGVAMSRATGMRLDEIVTAEVSAPLGLEDAVFFGSTRSDDTWRSRCAPTGWSPWRGRSLLGEVHDDNCAALGGVAGHAGMFGTANAVARFGAASIGAWHGRRGASEEALIRHATARRSGGTHRLGWDGKAERDSAAGSRIGAESFGHLGFTGTSLWCDPDRQAVIVLLTNRVAVSDENSAIRAFRPAFHDAVIAAFDEP
ncbi:MAG TPA: serine hydrolase domain-containing protein [Polyangiales bacterium]|nr:serine hydrolase domain-containing protein [Polyangiales bacterium]